MITNYLMFGFSIGMITCLLVYKVMYHIVWYLFKKEGKNLNLRVIRCKTCKCWFYGFDFETTLECGNCIYLRISKERKNNDND